jgi:hypothetical protein
LRPRASRRAFGLLAFETVHAVFVGCGDVGELVDKLAHLGESCGGLFFQVAVQAAEEFE